LKNVRKNLADLGQEKKIKMKTVLVKNGKERKYGEQLRVEKSYVCCS
jgi:hypothetical protein